MLFRSLRVLPKSSDSISSFSSGRGPVIPLREGESADEGEEEYELDRWRSCGGVEDGGADTPPKWRSGTGAPPGRIPRPMGPFSLWSSCDSGCCC